MEFEVISGAKRIIEKFRPVLYVENGVKDKSKALIMLIISLGYRLYWHLPPFFNPSNFSSDSVNIYGGNIYKGEYSTNMLCIHKNYDLKIDGFIEVSDPDFYPFG